MPASSTRKHDRTGGARHLLRAGFLLTVSGLTVSGVLACAPPDANAGGAAGANTADQRAALATGARRRETPRVRVSALEQGEMLQVLETTTVVESEVEIELRPRTTGMVVAVLAEEGDHVERGTVLARIDDRDAALAVRDAEVALEDARNGAETAALATLETKAAIDNAKLGADQAERDFQRNKRLFEGGDLPRALSEQTLETSQLALQTARHDVVKAELAFQRAEVEERAAKIAVSRAEVALARAELTHEHTSIRAPFDAVVAKRSIRVGDTAGSEPVFTLTDTENLRAVFYRPQRELALFTGSRPGHPSNGDGTSGSLEVTAAAEALPGARFRGRIERTSPTVDPDSGSFRVTAHLQITPDDADEPRLLPGLLVRLRIVTDRRPNALVAPKRAVRREAELAYVLKVEDGVAHRVEVTEGFQDDERVELIPVEPDALAPGDALVTVGARELQDGSPVEVETAADALLPEEADAAAADGTEASDPGAEADDGGDAADETGDDGSGAESADE
jgi:RND family efflux transporter MFP subunit